MTRKVKKFQFTEREIQQAVGFFRRLKLLSSQEQRRLLLGMRATPDVRRLLAAAEARIALAERHGCSMSVIDATNYQNAKFVTRGRVWTREATRIGDAAGTTPTRRCVPDNAVADEDHYDAMTPLEATCCNDPPSATGLQMIAWSDWLRAKDERMAKRRRRLKTSKNKKVAKSSEGRSLGAGNAANAVAFESC